jgi:hypothetical protein
MASSQANTQAVSTPDSKSGLLRNAMRANGVFSAVSGAAALLFSSTLADTTGIQPPLVFTVLGVILILYAIDLFWVTSRPQLDIRFGWAAVVLDLAWVLGSLVLLLTDLLPLTTAGKWIIAILADIVLVFAIVQFIGIRRLARKS